MNRSRTRGGGGVLAIVFRIAILLATWSTQGYAQTALGSDANQQKHFIQVSDDGRSFTLDGKKFFVHGFNQPQMMTHAVDNKVHILEVLEDAELHGFNLMRTWAFNDGFDQWNSLQLFPGIFDEKVFRALDYVLLQSRKHKIRVLLSITNQWEDYGGITQYYDWANVSGGVDSFYSNLECRGMYQNFVRTLLERKNMYTGIRYKDDEFILGWDLVNEPRMENGPDTSALQSWTDEMARFIKSVDSNHLVTSGSEGFFGPSTPSLLAYNPGDWTNDHGVDFVANHNSSSIDFGVFHLYPDNWFDEEQCDMDCALKFTQEYINAHLTSGLRKPVLLEEVGKKGEGRDQFLERVYEMMHNNHINGGYAAGTVIWQLSASNFSDVDSFSIYLPDDISTGNLIKSMGMKVAERLHSSFQRGVQFVGWVKEIVKNKVKKFMGNRFWKKHILTPDKTSPSSIASVASVASVASASNNTVDEGSAANPQNDTVVAYAWGR